MGTRLHGTGSPSPDAHGSLDKISRRGGCSAAWLVRAGSWVTALPDPAGSRATTQALALSSPHLDCCQQVQAREQSNSVLSYGGRGTQPGVARSPCQVPRPEPVPRPIVLIPHLPSASHQAVPWAGDAWRKSGLGIPRSALPWLNEVKGRAGQGPVRDIWDRLGYHCGTRTPEGLQPGTWVSSG